jgi:hypothetical protein
VYALQFCAALPRKGTKNFVGAHFNVHRLVLRKLGRQAKIACILAIDNEPMFTEVFCQRFFAAGAQNSFFTVNVLDQVQYLVETRPIGHANVFRALIDAQLIAGSNEQDARARIYNS